LPIPLSVSKTVTFVTRALYVRPRSEVNFLCVLFFVPTQINFGSKITLSADYADYDFEKAKRRYSSERRKCEHQSL
jgi:hypothetical protein